MNSKTKSNKTNGWWGKIAFIDLEHRRVSIQKPALKIYTAFLGGRGLAGFYLKDKITLSYDDPQMPLLIFTGPLTGTPAPTSGRVTFMSRSPLTGGVGDASAGGNFGAALKRCGLDGLVITGKSASVCGIEISNEKIRITDASTLAGALVQTAHKQLAPKGSTAVIGPAAENGAMFANVMIDGRHAAGRTGIGLVFASKNIKYITVSGNKRPPVFDRTALQEASADVMRLIAASPFLMGPSGISAFGTGALYDLMDARNMMPANNFSASKFEHAAALNAPSFKKQYGFKSHGCSGCHIRCKKTGRDNRQIPEFETMSHFSALTGNSDIEVVRKANLICDDYGMDTISAAATLAAYFELEKRRPGPGEILRLLGEMGDGQGIGKELSCGAARWCAAAGHPETAMCVKNLELPAYDPRGAYGMALAYAVSTRGGCHLRAYPIGHEILRKPAPTDRFSFAGKARMIKNGEDANAVADSLIACKFTFLAATCEEYAKVFTAATGISMTGQDLLLAGERICYNERIANSKNGFSESDDDLPARFFSPSGPDALAPIDRKDFLAARSAYYRVRGLDESGMPFPEKTRELGL
ncbi:MAG: aldehyde ferredoxin oxidoreductase family protein [Deltaproteobacteria bacterium]|nr:aldehyde ferredoxin oxidoreductase family protein [Deltaproteobacteria bacterium]